MSRAETDTAHAKEFEQIIPPIECTDDDNDNDTPAATAVTPNPPCERPTLDSLYCMDQSKICTASVERTSIRCMWPWWKGFISQHDSSRDCWVPKYGLQLYNKRTISNINIHTEYDHETVDAFFQYLLSHQAGESVMTKAKTFSIPT